MRKVVLLIALAVGMTAGATAQIDIKYGVRAGLNINSMNTWFSAPGGAFMEASTSGVGFNLGGVADITLFKNFSVQPGLSFTTKGGEDGLYYLEVPVLASYAYPINDNFKIRGLAGPAFGFGIFGSEEHAFGDEGMFKRFNVDLVIGAGVDFKNYYFGIAYHYGLTNAVASDFADAMKATGISDMGVDLSTFSINVGYNF